MSKKVAVWTHKGAARERPIYLVEPTMPRFATQGEAFSKSSWRYSTSLTVATGRAARSICGSILYGDSSSAAIVERPVREAGRFLGVSA